MKSKIHRATVTRADLHYEGSLSIAPELLQAADLVPGEQVHVINVSNGSRGVTYAIKGEPGEIALNGAMAHLGAVGDIVIVIAYASVDESEVRTFTPRVVHATADNGVREMVAAR